MNPIGKFAQENSTEAVLHNFYISLPPRILATPKRCSLTARD